MLKYLKHVNMNIRNLTNSFNILNLTKPINHFYNFTSFNLTVKERDKFKQKYKLFRQNKEKLNKSKKKNNNIQITQKNLIMTEEAMSPEIREELDKQVESMTNLTKDIDVINSSNITERMNAHEYMKNMDSSFEGFFFKREFNLTNFNYYIQILSRQSKTDEFQNTLTKMEEFGIKPNMETYTHMMTGYARAKDIQKCEEIFDLVKNQKKMLPNKFMYNSLLLAYAKNVKIQESDALMREMKNEGINPDVICYTTLIHSYKKGKLYNKCWDLYYEAITNNVADEFLMSYMIRMCAATHDSEKALNLYQAMDIKGFMKHTINFNSIIFALSSKKKYAEQALEMFQKMKLMNIKPDLHTYVGVLRATSHLGDINTANDVVKEIKLLGMPINEYICNGLIRTYAGASRIKYVKTEHLESYIKDTWEIYNFMERENIPINVQVLNAILEVHTANHKIEMVDGLVVPLFEKHNIQMNQFTYQHIFGMLIDLRNFDGVIDLYAKMKGNNIMSNQKILNIYLESSMRSNNSDGIVEALETVREINRTVDPWLLRILTSQYDLPDRLFVELKNHLPFNFMTKERWKMFTPATFREKSRAVPKAVFRRDNRRIKLR